jgi:hypothetical protein
LEDAYHPIKELNKAPWCPIRWIKIIQENPTGKSYRYYASSGFCLHNSSKKITLLEDRRRPFPRQRDTIKLFHFQYSPKIFKPHGTNLFSSVAALAAAQLDIHEIVQSTLVVA